MTRVPAPCLGVMEHICSNYTPAQEACRECHAWLLFIQGCGLEVAQFFQSGEDAVGALCDGLFVGLEEEFGRLRLLVGIVDAGEIGNFASVGEFVEALEVTLAADLDGTLDVDLDEIANFLARPGACFPVGGDGGGDADHSIAREERAYEGDALDVGIAFCAAEAEAFAQVRAYDIAIPP